MDPTRISALARIWADAMPLYSFIEEKAKQQVRESTPASTPTQARQLSSLEPAVRIMQLHADLAVARDKVRAAAINDLIAGRIVGLGRPSDSYLFDRVDDSFWIGAAVDWIGGTASRDGKTIIEIRVVPAGTLKPAKPEAQSSVGRPSKEEVISAAIAAYIKEDSTLARPPAVRFRAYRTYISSCGYNPHKDPGFSTKTFEKYERKFRIENR